MLEIAARLLPGEDPISRWAEALAHADAGLEEVSKELARLEHLDLLRLVPEAKDIMARNAGRISEAISLSSVRRNGLTSTN